MALNTAYSSIANVMVPDLPGAESSTILFYLHRAGRQFCQDAEVFEKTITDTLVEDTATYSLAVTDTQCKRIKRVRFVDETVEDYNDYHAGREIHPDYYYLQRNSGTGADEILFETNGTPSSDDDGNTLVVLAAYVPHLNVDVLPDAFLTEWSDAIRLGAMVELLSLPNRPWTDPAAAAVYNTRYNDAVARARFEETHENKRIVITMKAPSFT
jgi:hypothetical protein